MRIVEFDYELPDELIAQQPLERRDGSRMLAVDRASNSFQDQRFTDFPDRLREGDLIVINNTKVFPARLRGRTETGAEIEVFLIRENLPSQWEVLAKPGRRLRVGKRIIFSKEFSASVVDKLPGGEVVVGFECEQPLDELIDQYGQTPLPPYIKRDETTADHDRERYQTVYAEKRGAIAAPTAGLHFTPEVISAIRARGFEIAEVTLHVGYGTFEPVRVDDLSKHAVLPERYEITREVADKLTEVKRAGGRLVSIGTTTTRALESNVDDNGRFTAGRFAAELTITPAYNFRAIDALLTNFHLPKSSLLVLTSVFGGHELIMRAYRHAVAANYRFYSYGDCMFIE